LPRKAPTQVIEHRISLSNFERQQLLDQLEKHRENRLYSSGISQVGGVLGSGVLLYGLAGYFGFSLLGKGKETFDNVTNTLSDYLFNWLSGGNVADPVKEARFASAFDRLDEAILVHNELNATATAELIGIRKVAAETGDTVASARMLELVEQIRLLSLLRSAIDITLERVREFNRAYVRDPEGNNCPEWLGLENWQDLLRANDTYGNTGPDVMPDWEPLFA
jgi:hypothetical protein